MVRRSGFASRSKKEAFEDNIIPEPNSGCWLWLGTYFALRGGYGAFTHRPSGTFRQRAHRAAWQIFRGDITPDQHVLHRCDNPACVNPDHLFLGNQAVNMEDMAFKGRQAKGRRNANYLHGRYVGQKANPKYATQSNRSYL